MTDVEAAIRLNFGLVCAFRASGAAATTPAVTAIAAPAAIAGRHRRAWWDLVINPHIRVPDGTWINSPLA